MSHNCEICTKIVPFDVRYALNELLDFIANGEIDWECEECGKEGSPNIYDSAPQASLYVVTNWLQSFEDEHH